jgi:hypothetical protein
LEGILHFVNNGVLLVYLEGMSLDIFFPLFGGISKNETLTKVRWVSKDGMPTKVVRIPFRKNNSQFFGYFVVTPNGYSLNIMGTKK